MSEVTIESLQKELNQHKEHIKGLVAQVEATKEMLNESFSTNLQLRTNINVIKRTYNEHVKESSVVKDELNAVKNELNALKEKENINAIDSQQEQQS
jgi:uncharacterized coiled-coil DUF342 family protein